MGWGRRGPARAGWWLGAHGRGVLRGEGWRHDAEGESVPNPWTEPANKVPPYSWSACRALLCASARAANKCAYALPAVQTCAWPFWKALLLAIVYGLSALWAKAGVCCGPIAPGGKRCAKSLMGSCVGGDAPSPVGPRAGGRGEEVGVHVQAELRWGWGVAWRRPRAPARARTSSAWSSCPGAKSTCMVKSTCNNINVLKVRASHVILSLSSNVLYFGKVKLAARTAASEVSRSAKI
jgi:hypothetical protein